jgi:hypothetical protein
VNKKDVQITSDIVTKIFTMYLKIQGIFSSLNLPVCHIFHYIRLRFSPSISGLRFACFVYTVTRGLRYLLAPMLNIIFSNITRLQLI